MTKWTVAGVMIGWFAGTATVSMAQPTGGGRTSGAAVVVAAPDRERSGSLQSRLAIAVAERLIFSDSSEDRVRGVERLTSAGQREGVDRLLRALAEGGPVFRDARARLTAVRGLAPFASREAVRQQLAKELAVEPGAVPLLGLVRATAAMALAASEDARAVDVLVGALRQGGAAAEAAGRALLAYPPRSLASFGNPSEGLPAPLCELIGRLGDVRAMSLLKGTLARGLLRASAASGSERTDTADDEEESKRARVAAAIALARLGDQEQVPIAENWASSSDPYLKVRGVEVLLLSGAARARRALLPMLMAPETRDPALAIAAQSPSVELLPGLEESLKFGGDGARRAVVLLGRIGGVDAVRILEKLLRDPERAGEAAFALARAPGSEARRALEAAASEPKLARLAARAGTVRALALGDAPSGLGAGLSALLASRDAADRAAAALGLAVLGKADVRELLASPDLAVVRAAARAALAAPRDVVAACRARLATETDGLTRTALAIAIAASPDAQVPVSTGRLAEWAESDEAFAPLAVVALGPRERPLEKRRIGRALDHSDPVLRAHAAFALALSPLPDAVSRLAGAWRFEETARVRRAIVIALGQRKEPQRVTTLELAAKLDPDEQVRESARLALRGQLPLPLGRFGAGCAGSEARVGGCYAAWITLTPTSPAGAAELKERSGRLLDAAGLALPVVADPDGMLVVPGVSAGAASFRLASSPLWYDAQTHDVSEAGHPR
jgi:cellulose synthase operon protein C